MSLPENKRAHAVVIGAGISGLLSARVLSNHFASVTVLEKDLQSDINPRRGAPQGNHIHVLWSVGASIIESFFPGVFEELATQGAVSFDNSADMRWFHGGVWKLRMNSGMKMHSQSRPLLEHHIRERLQQSPNISFIQGSVSQANFSLSSPPQVVYTDAGKLQRLLDADFVLDASGRGSNLPKWLRDQGFATPPEQSVGVDLRYASRLYQKPRNNDWHCMAIYARPPESKKSGVIFPIEGDRWIVTLGGCLGEHPGNEEAEFLEFARNLERPDLHDAIQLAEPASDISSFRFPNQLWRRYDKIKMPKGLGVTGDALCSFNPLYGQGITVSAQLAAALDECMTKPDPNRVFQKRSAQIIRSPWLLATGTDLLYPEVAGDRPRWVRPLGRYIDRLLRLSESDPHALRVFLEVLHLSKPPSHLVHPRTLVKVARSLRI